MADPAQAQDPGRDRAAQEAAAWFARLSRLSVTTEALRDFRAWRQDPANAAAYAAIDDTWTRAGQLSSDPDIRRATAAALQRRPAKADRPRKPRPLLLGAITAAALLLAAAVVFLQLRPTVYETATGEQRRLVLADGSRVQLNTDSRIAVRYTGGARRIALTRGQAFFEVAPDPARPFEVDAGPATVRALGTRFDVWRQDTDVRVALVEGKVSVARDGGPPAILRPRQAIHVTRAGLTPVTAADPVDATGWTTGRLTFRDTPLAQAVAEVNRYSGTRIELAPGAPADRPVSGVFDAGDTQAFVRAASVLLDLEARRQGGAIRLGPRRTEAS